MPLAVSGFAVVAAALHSTAVSRHGDITSNNDVPQLNRRGLGALRFRERFRKSKPGTNRRCDWVVSTVDAQGRQPRDRCRGAGLSFLVACAGAAACRTALQGGSAPRG